MAQISVRLNMFKIKVFVFSDGDLAIFHAVSTLNPTTHTLLTPFSMRQALVINARLISNVWSACLSLSVEV